MLARRHVPVLGKQDLRPFRHQRNFNQFFRFTLNLRDIGHTLTILFQVRPLQVQYIAEPQTRFTTEDKQLTRYPHRQIVPIRQSLLQELVVFILRQKDRPGRRAIQKSYAFSKRIVDRIAQPSG